jgi:hypothetical protein
LEGLGARGVTVVGSPNRLPVHQLFSPTPGTKSPVMLSPGQEHKMEVVIATKYGKQKIEPGMGDEAESLAEDSTDGAHGKTNARIKTHRDREFDRLMDNVDRIKQQHQQEVCLFNVYIRQNCLSLCKNLLSFYVNFF